MAWDKPDVYYQPEKFGLTLVGAIEWYDESYSFTMTIVLKDEQGNLYWGDDLGCSCPSPFESFTSIDKLTQGTADKLQAHLDEWLNTKSAYSVITDEARAAAAEIMLKVRS